MQSLSGGCLIRTADVCGHVEGGHCKAAELLVSIGGLCVQVGRDRVTCNRQI